MKHSLLKDGSLIKGRVQDAVETQYTIWNINHHVVGMQMTNTNAFLVDMRGGQMGQTLKTEN